jgi:hypothetical protein
MSAPELAPLALLENAIHFARLSLLAEHPQLLYDDEPLLRATCERRAELVERFLHRAYDLCTVLWEYRIEAAHVIEHERTSRRDARRDDGF